MCGYGHVPGIDYSKNYSLVMNDIMLCVLLLIMIHFGLLAKEVNVETAFLYGELEDEIYMECPTGMEGIRKNDCIIFGQVYLWPHSGNKTI